MPNNTNKMHNVPQPKPFRPKSIFYQSGWWYSTNRLSELFDDWSAQSRYVETLYHSSQKVILDDQNQVDYVAGCLAAARLFDRRGFVVNENVT